MTFSENVTVSFVECQPDEYLADHKRRIVKISRGRDQLLERFVIVTWHREELMLCNMIVDESHVDSAHCSVL